LVSEGRYFAYPIYPLDDLGRDNRVVGILDRENLVRRRLALGPRDGPGVELSSAFRHLLPARFIPQIAACVLLPASSFRMSDFT